MRNVIVAVVACGIAPASAPADPVIEPLQFVGESIRSQGGERIDRFRAEVVKLEGKLVRDGKEVDFTGDTKHRHTPSR